MGIKLIIKGGGGFIKNLFFNPRGFIKGQNMIFNKKNVLSNLKTCYPMQNRVIQCKNILNVKNVEKNVDQLEKCIILMQK